MHKYYFLIPILFVYSVEVCCYEAISSVYNGLQLKNELGLARVGAWSDQNRVGFSGYGLIENNSMCLTAAATTYITWRPCSETRKSQKWAITKEKTLVNELGFCAEIEAYKAEILNPRLIAKECNLELNLQHWLLH